MSRPSTGVGIKAWEALLNEILELKGSELGSASDAYRFLRDIEGLVLPAWQVHGKQLLSESGVDLISLRGLGMPSAEIEKLYQAIYAFAFGFSRTIKNSAKFCKDGGKLLLQNISGLYSTLLVEALEHDFHDLLTMIFNEKDTQISDLQRECAQHQTSILILQRDLASAREQGAGLSSNLARAVAQAHAAGHAALAASAERDAALSGLRTAEADAAREAEATGRLLRTCAETEGRLAAAVAGWEAEKAALAALQQQADAAARAAAFERGDLQRQLQFVSERLASTEQRLADSRAREAAETLRADRNASELAKALSPAALPSAR